MEMPFGRVESYCWQSSLQLQEAAMAWQHEQLAATLNPSDCSVQIFIKIAVSCRHPHKAISIPRTSRRIARKAVRRGSARIVATPETPGFIHSD
jgi:hypothetical protein